MTNAISHSNKLVDIIALSEKLSWKLEDVISKDDNFDFTKKFLPDAFFPMQQFSFLSDQDQLSFNHIIAHSYLNIFEFSEEFIIGLTLQLTNQAYHHDRDALRALARFSEEEVKHQELFRLGKELIQNELPVKLNVLNNAVEVSDFILGHSKLATLILTIHLELITQSHFVDGVKEKKDLDPLFASVLRHHWIEECQHIKIDIIEFNKLAENSSPAEIDKAFIEYREMIVALNQILHVQAVSNVEDLENLLDRQLDPSHKHELTSFVHECYNNGLIQYGFIHPDFKKMIEELYSDGEDKLNSLSAQLDELTILTNKK